MCVQKLLEYDADPNVVNNHSGFTPLHWAARYGEDEIVKLLLSDYKETVNEKRAEKTPACPYIPDFAGFTPLDYAGKFGHLKVVKFLIEKIFEEVEEKMIHKS